MKVMILLMATSMMLLTGCASEKNQEKELAKTNQTQVDKDNKEETSGTIKVTHDLGEVELPMNPKKIVVFDFAALDTIDALGAEVELAVPISSVPSFLEEYKNVVNAGDIKEPNIEEIYEFEPDMIIISGRQQESYEQLNEIAPTWFIPTSTGNSVVEDFERNYTILGQLLGKEEQAQELITKTLSEIEEVAKLGEQLQGNALVVLTNDGGISAYGKASRFGIIHDILKVKPADENIESSTHGQEVGFEYIADINPDILFVVDRNAVVAGSNNASDTLDNELIKGTKAYQNQRIVYLNAEHWYLAGNGLTVLPQMVEEIKNVLEGFEK